MRLQIGKFIFKLLIIILITLVADRVLGFIMKRLYEKTTTTDEYKLNEVIERMEAPVVFMGSSRCHHHYVPSVIADTLGKEVFNAGLWGMRNIYFQYALLSNVLERYSPETIFLEIHPIDYLKTPFSDLETMGVLSPFINYSPGGDEVLKKAELYYKNKLSVLYRYNSLFPNLLAGNLAQRTDPDDKGFKPLEGQMELKAEIQPERFPFPADEEKIKYLQRFIDECRKRDINLVFIFSPMYVTEKDTRLFDIPDSIAKKNNIPLINRYNMKGITGHAEYFHDFGHLNSAGAAKYSSMIAPQLKQYIRKD